MTNKVLFGVIPLVLLAGCQTLSQRHPDQYLSRYGVPEPTRDAFHTCARTNCNRQSALAYQPHEWSQIEALFSDRSRSAAEERQAVRQAVALMETFVGSKNNTAGDLGRNKGWFAGSPQLDCVAETINTTVALLLLEQNQLLAHHSVAYPRHRGFLDLTGPHYTAVLLDRRAQQDYVVDSWFFDNGQLPVVVTAQEWQAGYDPDDTP